MFKNFMKLNGGVEKAWNKCLPEWETFGRVNDFPMDELRNIYTPSEETILGPKSYDFISQRS